MKFAKGVAVGALITAGAMMMYSEEFDTTKKKMVRKGKQMLRRFK